jgi:hypothetical protein
VTWQKSDYDDTPKTSATTVAVVAGTFATPLPIPTISGTAKVGQTLTAGEGTWSPTTDSYTYVWSSSATATGTYAAISGATGKTYELTSTDRGKFVKVTVTGVKSGYTSTPSLSAATTAVVAAFTTAPTPTITGTVRVGQTLTAVPGTWSPVAATLTYQWKRDGSNISGATTATYLLTGADQGAAISVAVTGAALTYETTTKTSDSTEAVARGVFTTAPTPTITGTAISAQTLTAVPGTWAPTASFTYRWLAGTDVVGTASTLLVTADMVGKQITVEVTGAATGYTSQAKTSAATAAVTLPLIATAPVPTISGTVKFGNTLTAVPGVVPAGTTGATVKGYQWSRATTATGVFENITDATSSTYALTASDVTKFIRVTVTWQKSGSGDTPKTSATTVAVVAGTFATPLPIPTISGTKAVGQTLTANPGTWTPAVDSSTYTWWRANTATGKYATIAGATTATYTLQSADLGKFIKVTVTGTKAGYTTVTGALSAATTAIAG